MEKGLGILAQKLSGLVAKSITTDALVDILLKDANKYKQTTGDEQKHALQMLEVGCSLLLEKAVQTSEAKTKG